MTPLQRLREAYRARKRGRTRAQALGVAAQQAKADQRAAAYIERLHAGETHEQIAQADGVTANAVRHAIRRYRKRHPDVSTGGPT